MKKEEVIQSAVMFTVSVLALIGFTVAWYSRSLGAVVASGMQMSVPEQGDIRIALTSGGDDISALEDDKKCVDVGLEKLTNIEFVENGSTVWKMAPGAYGEVVFYVTPLKHTVDSCAVLPEVRLKDKDGNLVTKDNSSIQVPDGAGGAKAVNVYEIANEHIIFYYYKDGQTEPVLLNMTAVPGEGEASVTTRESAAFGLNWNNETNTGAEREIRLYWRWDYEYPTDRSLPSYALSMSEQEKKELYDEQDTIIGNYIRQMNFHFEFAPLQGNTPLSQTEQREEP